MRIIQSMLIAGLAIGSVAAPAGARHHNNGYQHSQYQYNGHNYNNLQQCLDAKRRAKKNGAIAGAVVAGVGAALLGANFGETALVAGGGAVVGHTIGASKKC